MFVQLCGLDNGIKYEELHDFDGLDVHEQSLRLVSNNLSRSSSLHSFIYVIN